MKRIVKKNQFILTLLAVIIAVAGYGYARKFQMSGKKQAAATAAETGEGTLAAGLLEISDEELLAENQAGKDISVAEEGQEEALAQENGTADESGADTAGADMPGEAV
ncbi:MAG: SpoIIIAH-like family protein [Lachnospiraceae bacterium]